MDLIALPVDVEIQSQLMTINVQPNGYQRTLQVQIDYRKYVGKYFVSVKDVVEGQDILINYPVIASEPYALNDLLKQVAYKCCGSLFCYPLQNEPTYPDPNGTIEEFELVWGDSPWLT